MIISNSNFKKITNMFVHKNLPRHWMPKVNIVCTPTITSELLPVM